MWVKLLSFHVVLDLIADVFDDSVDEFEAIKFALEGRFACFIKCLL